VETAAKHGMILLECPQQLRKRIRQSFSSPANRIRAPEKARGLPSSVEPRGVTVTHSLFG